MADKAHSALTDTDGIHEPKGAGALTGGATDTGKVCKSDGDGTTSWSYLTDDDIDSGASTAGKAILADGSGGAAWDTIHPYGSFFYNDHATPTVLAATTGYKKLDNTNLSFNPASGVTLNEMTYSDGRLTYTGTNDRHFHIVFNMSIDQASGVDRDVTIALYKDGTIIPHAECIQTTQNSKYVSTALHADVMMSTNEYLEAFVKISVASNVNFYNFYMFAMGMPG